jgi:O-antigen ligase
LEHAHNSYLNIGVELGLFGLLAFLALLGQVLVQLWREFRLADPRTQALAAGLGAALIGYALQSLTVSLYAVQLIQAVFFILVGASLALPRLRQPPSATAQRP